MQTGLARRFSRLMKGSPGSSLLVALDHGLTSGPPPGFEHYSCVQSWIEHPDVDAIVMHKGALKSFTHRGMALTKPIILQSNGMSDRAANPADKPILIEIEDALRLGADAISLEFAAEPASFGENLRALSAHIDSADRLGVPVMVMLSIANAPVESDAWVRTHLATARTLVELGASIIKMRQPPDASDWRPMIDGIREDVHIVMAGGPADRPEVVLERARMGMDAGAGGVCMGRNIFQHPQPGQFLTELGTVVHGAARRRTVPADLVVAGS
jgi:fructose-bisphosphate aldolase, class I